MEEKKNNQVQALDDDELENVAGGWVEVTYKVGRGRSWKEAEAYALVDFEVNKLKEMGCTVKLNKECSIPAEVGGIYDVYDASGNKMYYSSIKEILGKESSI